MFSIATKPIDSRTLVHGLTSKQAGALVTFEGWVRNHNDGKEVTKLAYEAYVTLAVKEANKIIAEARSMYGILDASCVHRVGELQIGDVAVWVGVVAVHRREAFAACAYIIDEIKHRLPIWKQEFYADGTVEWVNCQACAASGQVDPAPVAVGAAVRKEDKAVEVKAL